MLIRGKVVVYNKDNVSTDEIIPGPYGYIQDMKEMAEHILEGADPALKEKLQRVGDIFVSGRNFGCGSSREYAVIVFKERGVKAVVVKSAARIWYRNAINLGLPVVVCDTLPDSVSDGEEIEIDLEKGIITELATGKVHKANRPNSFVLQIYREGGLKNTIRKKMEQKNKNES